MGALTNAQLLAGRLRFLEDEDKTPLLLPSRPEDKGTEAAGEAAAECLAAAAGREASFFWAWLAKDSGFVAVAAAAVAVDGSNRAAAEP